jgi:antitoxin component YwqK of YwqJK toxin-antitoxin module
MPLKVNPGLKACYCIWRFGKSFASLASRPFIKISCLICLVLCACHSHKEDESLVLIQIQDRNGLSETISNPDRLSSYEKMNFLSSQPYKKVMRVYKKEGKNQSILTTYHPNGSTWQMLEAKEMRANGAFREWFPGGGKKIEATVIGGSADLSPGAQSSWLFDGLSSVWDEDGHLTATMLYDKGVLSGDSTYYYSSGSVEKIVPYQQDRIEGDLKEYWEDGRIKRRTTYQNGLKEGSSVAFWQDGRPSFEEEYEQGRLKTGRYWFSNQEPISEVKDGEGFRAIFDRARLVQIQEIRKGEAEGIVKNFDAAGEVSSTYYLKNGKKHGEEIEYYPRAEAQTPLAPKVSIAWDQDAIHGLVKTWYDNGQIESQREMCRNKRNGILCCWYRDGALMLTEEYENDELVRGQYYRKNSNEPISTISNGSGTATIYDEDGVFLRKVSYSNRKIVDLE